MGLFSWLFGSSTPPEPPAPVEQFEYVVWFANNSAKPEWKSVLGTFSSEDDAYAEAAKLGSESDVRAVRVLKSDRQAPPADSPILAGRVAVAPDVPGVQKAQKFTFHKDGTVRFESGSEIQDYRYTIDNGELWIAWVFAGRVSDQVYKFMPDGFHIHRAKERTAKDWYEFNDLGPNHIYKWVS